jgi:hypothetical protein
VLYIMINVQTFEHIMNEIDPVSTQTQPKQRTAFRGVLKSVLAAIGAKSPDTIVILKYRTNSMSGVVLYSYI